LRRGLAEAPIVATSDPLPAAFNATLGRVLPIGGTEGVALLVTMIMEFMSNFGLAGLVALHGLREMQGSVGSPAQGSLLALAAKNSKSEGAQKVSLPRRKIHALTKPSLRSSVVVPSGRARESREATIPPYRRLPEGPSPTQPAGGSVAAETHVAVFIRDRLEKVEGASIAASELRGEYEVWCAERGEKPFSSTRFGSAMTALGYTKWKSCGLVRYRDLQLVATAGLPSGPDTGAGSTTGAHESNAVRQNPWRAHGHAEGTELGPAGKKPKQISTYGRCSNPSVSATSD
jgi:hypothetical protein